MKRVLVTGGSGFIGGHLCEALIKRGHQPVVLDRVRPSRPSAEFHSGDLSDLGGRLGSLLDNVSTVYHLAWTTKPQAANDAPYADVQSNVVSGLLLLDAIVRRASPPRLVFLSTGGAIYGRTDVERIGEDHPTVPLNAYGVSKLTFEHYLRLYHYLHDLDYIAFRPSNPYGEHQDPRGAQGAVAVFLGRLAKGEPITVWGDGSVVRDYLHIDDLTDALVRAVGYAPSADDPRVFNVGSGGGESLLELIAAMERVTGRRGVVDFTEARKADAPRVVLDIGRIKAMMGWAPTISLDEGLARTWRWITAGAR